MGRALSECIYANCAAIFPSGGQLPDSVDAVTTPVPPPPPPPAPVPPPPVAPPVTVPPSPPTVEVHVPHDTINQLTQPPDWWYTNGATVAAAVIAAIAAFLAYRGIVKQIGANQDNMTQQIAANQAAVQQQITAENLRRKHEVRTVLVNDANQLAAEAREWALRPGRRATTAMLEEKDLLDRRVTTQETSLRLHGLNDQSVQLVRFWRLALDRGTSGPGNGPEIELPYTDLLASLKQAIPDLDN